MKRTRTWIVSGLLIIAATCVLAPAVAVAQGAPTCGPADAQLADGNLAEAAALYEAVREPCGEEGVRTVARLQSDAAEQVKAARAALRRATKPDADVATELAAARAAATNAARLDPQNEQAQVILTAASQPDVPAGLCLAGQEALERGDWHGAKELFDAAAAQDKTKGCAADGTSEAERARLATWPARANSVAGDLVPWLTISAGALLAGLFVFAFARQIRRKPLERLATSVGNLRLIIAAGVIAIASAVTFAVTSVVDASPSHRVLDDVSNQSLAGVVLIVAALVGGAALGRRLAAHRRLSFSTFTGQKDVDAAGLTALTAAEFAQLTDAAPSGVSLVVSGTDGVESPVNQIFELSPNKVMAALLAAWKAVTPASDLTLSAHVLDDGSGIRTAAVALRDRRSTVASITISTRSFAVTTSAPTESEKADGDRDLANAIASWLLLTLVAPDSPTRLYGTRTWAGLTLNAAAQRRVSRGDSNAARLLLARALFVDPHNVAPRFGLDNLTVLHPPSDLSAHRAAVERLGRLYDAQVKLVQSGPLATEPLGWRIAYAYGAALSNLSMVHAPRDSVDLEKARNVLWALVTQLEAWPNRADRVPGDEALVSRILAYAAPALGAVIIMTSATEWEAKAQSLLTANAPGTGSPQEEYNLACAAGAAYQRASEAGQDPSPWSEQAFARLRAAGEDPSFRTRFAEDPWLHLLKPDAGYAQLVEEWTGPAETVDFADIATIGKLAQPVVGLGYRDRTALLSALTDPATRASIRTAVGATDDVMRAWRGALTWRAMDCSVEHVNSVQRAGYADREALSGVAAAVAALTCRSWHLVSGYSAATAPTAADLQEMGAD